MNAHELLQSLKSYYYNYNNKISTHRQRKFGDLLVSLNFNTVSVINIVDGEYIANFIDDVTIASENITTVFMYNDLNKTVFCKNINREVQIIDNNSKVTRSKNILDLDLLSEEYLFQLSTTFDVPSLTNMEKINKYHKRLSNLCYIYDCKFGINNNIDWDNIPLTEEELR